MQGLTSLQPDKAYELAKQYSEDAKGALGDAVTAVIIKNGKAEDFEIVADHYKNLPPGQDKYDMTATFCDYLSKTEDVTKIKKEIDYIISFSQAIPAQYRTFTDKKIKASLDKIGSAKGREITDYINSNFKFVMQ